MVVQGSPTRLRRAIPAGTIVMYMVYVLRSLKDGKRYVGMTSDLNRRLEEHRRGAVKSTRNRRPLDLIHTESFTEKAQASRREEFFKTGMGRAYLNEL